MRVAYELFTIMATRLSTVKGELMCAFVETYCETGDVVYRKPDPGMSVLYVPVIYDCFIIYLVNLTYTFWFCWMGWVLRITRLLGFYGARNGYHHTVIYQRWAIAMRGDYSLHVLEVIGMGSFGGISKGI